jgi:formylglycine-generating enzyme required for sulfatase activity
MEKVSGVLRPSGAFGALPNGISDLGGNVWEWTASCASKDIDPARCPAFIVEGLHETALSVFVREPATVGCAAGAPPAHVGFRLVSGS